MTESRVGFLDKLETAVLNEGANDEFGKFGPMSEPKLVAIVARETFGLANDSRKDLLAEAERFDAAIRVVAVESAVERSV
jgi:hypothetical protein